MDRYAIYYAPRADEPLARFARDWLGRDPETGAEIAQPSTPGRLPEITAEPRRYGFHGTLKPPFALASTTTANMLREALADFTRERHAITLPALELKAIDGFLALVPAAVSPELNALAADCVQAFDTFRAPPSDSEMAERRRAGLSPRQDELLRRWGYPYVMEEFRFHLTLTARLSEPERDAVKSALERATEHLRGPLAIRDLVLFHQDRRDLPFNVVGRFPLTG